MKVNFSRETWTAKLDNEAIKAIRFVRGFNTDLRVELKGINKDSLCQWLMDNEIGVFGIDIMPRPESVSEEWDKYENMMWDVVRQIKGGK